MNEEKQIERNKDEDYGKESLFIAMRKHRPLFQISIILLIERDENKKEPSEKIFDPINSPSFSLDCSRGNLAGMNEGNLRGSLLGASF